MTSHLCSGGVRQRAEVAGLQRRGDLAAWRRDGRELYDLYSDGKLMAVPVEVSAKGFHAGMPQALFVVPSQSDFQPSADGKRFLVRLPPEGEPSVPPLEFVLNWPAGLKN